MNSTLLYHEKMVDRWKTYFLEPTECGHHDQKCVCVQTKAQRNVNSCGTTQLERMTLKIATAMITHAYHSSHLSFSCMELVSSVRFDKDQVV